jgi:hypothetical protein
LICPENAKRAPVQWFYETNKPTFSFFHMLFFRCEPLGGSTSSSFQNPPETLGSHPYKSPQKVAKKL